MDRYLILKIDLYNTDVMIYFGDVNGLLDELNTFLSEEETKDVKEIFKNVEEESTTLARTCLLESGQIVLWMPQVPATPTEKGTLQHEIFHVAFDIMDKVGIRLTPDCDEALAYLIGYISTKVEEFLMPSSGDAQSQ